MKLFCYISGICGAVLLACVQTGGAETLTQRQIPAAQSQILLSFSPLVKKVIPAVVNVYAARKIRDRSPFYGDPFFEQFFGQYRSHSSRIQSSLGSGVVVDASGLIVTNYHVIRDADKIRVALSDGREFESRVLLKDESMDIAILKIDTKGVMFPVLALANSDRVEVGDLVLAIGNPFGVGQTVTSGIVSAQARTGVGISDLDFFIQTDAAINPGNSGGALINMSGELIGVNTAIYSRTGGSNGVGFAIPSNLVRPVIDAVRSGKKNFDPPYFGATFQPITPDVAESLGMKQSHGVLVTDIEKNSPAFLAGLKTGDVILTVQETRVDNPDAFGYRLMTAETGKVIRIGIFRNGKNLNINVTLQAAPPDQASTPERINIACPLFGVEVMNLTPLNARRFHQSPTVRGVLISDIDTQSNAAIIFAKGDIIRAVNGQSVSTVENLKKILSAGMPRIWQFQYERNGVLIRQFIHQAVSD